MFSSCRLWVQPWGVSLSAVSVCLSQLRLCTVHCPMWELGLGALRQAGREAWALPDHPILPQLHHFPLLCVPGQEAHHLRAVRRWAGSVLGLGGRLPQAGPVPLCLVCAQVAGVTLRHKTCPLQALPLQSRSAKLGHVLSLHLLSRTRCSPLAPSPLQTCVWMGPSVCAGSRPTCSQSVPQSGCAPRSGVPVLGTFSGARCSAAGLLGALTH